VYTNAQPNITSVGNLTSLTVTGNVSANYFIGNGSLLTGLPEQYSNSNVANYLPNYTGNVSASYFIGNGASLTNITGANVTGFVPNANVANTAFSVSGSNVVGQVANALVAGTVYTNAQPNITSVGTLTSLAISGNLTTVDSVTYDTTAAITPGVAQSAWDDGEGTLALGLKGGNVVLNIGEQEVKRVYNAEANTLVKGEVVYVFGAQGNRISVKRALADSDANSASTIGIVQESIASGSEGFIINSGTLYKFNTSAYTPGLPIYLSPTTPGAFTTTKPLAPDHLVTLGWIERVHPTVGSIYIKINNGYELDELHNVSIANAANGQSLVYSNGIFINGNAQYSNTAGTVTTNAQPNITSVGTLGNLSVTNNLTVGGNFTVTGNLVYANVSDLVINDPLIYLASNNVGDTEDIGIVANFDDGVYQHGGIARDHTDKTWKFFANVVAEPTTTIDWANATYAPMKAGNITGANLTVTNANLGNLATANFFSGDGSNLTNLNIANAFVANANYSNFAGTAYNVSGSNVTGTVASATVAASANSVAGANVSGTVANATHAVSSDSATVAASANSVAGANVSGAVSFATTANSVAGANVSGAVSFATTANSVAGANVSGTVANATFATSAGSATTATSATTAGTVTTGPQPNITSVGTLGGLTVNGTTTLGFGSQSTSIGAWNANTGNIQTLNIRQEWSNASIQYVPILERIIDSGGSAANSLLIDLRYGNSQSNLISKFAVNKDGNVYANVYYGNGSQLTGITATTAQTVSNAAQPNITSVGTLTSLSVTGNITSDNANLGNLVTANFFSGSGNNLSNIQGANVSGAVASATVAASANSVAGANVTGEVAFAATANSVAGANVSGAVSFATTANSVAVGNVVGIGNIATTNYNGNGSQVLAGNGAWVAQTGGGGGGTPGGSNTQLQFNNNGSFGGIPNVTYNGTNIALGNISTVKMTGGVNNEVIRTDGTGNLSFSSIALTLLVGTRAGAYTVPITNYTFPVTQRNGSNVTVYVN